MSEPVKIEFKDKRTQKEFSVVTFSGYQKLKVRQELLKSIRDRQLEPACYWTAELVSSGHFSSLWETIFQFYFQCVHTGHLKLILYLQDRYALYNQITKEPDKLSGLTSPNPLQYRNNPHIRRLFTEVVSVLSLAPRRPVLVRVVLPANPNDLTLDMTEHQRRLETNQEEMDLSYLSMSGASTSQTTNHSIHHNTTQNTPQSTAAYVKKRVKSTKKMFLFHPTFMTEKVCAPNDSYYLLQRDKDPDEWFVALNEMSFHLREGNIIDACFWLEWLLEYDSYCRANHKEIAAVEGTKGKGVNKGASRGDITGSLIPYKLCNDMIWAVWEVFYSVSMWRVSNTYKNDHVLASRQGVIKKILEATQSLFCIEYTTASCGKKRFWMYYAVLLLADSSTTNDPSWIDQRTVNGEESMKLVKDAIEYTDRIYMEVLAAEQAKDDVIERGMSKMSNRDKYTEKEAMDKIRFFN
jgi:hypothetical protein